MADPPSRIQLLRESWTRYGEVLPEMRRPSFIVVVWGGITLVLVPSLIIAGKIAASMPYGAIVVESGFLSLAGAFMYLGFWRHRAAYRERYGRLAYRQLFFRYLLGFFAGGSAALIFPAIVRGARFLPSPLAYALAIYCLLTMQLLAARGTEIFWDVEWRAFVYNVFPERGRVVTTGIFDQLRHPVYSAAVRMTFGLALLRNNRAALACAALAAVVFWLWSRVEEDDLQRKDPDYGAYRQRVPAFFVVPPLRFWRYLVAGTE